MGPSYTLQQDVLPDVFDGSSLPMQVRGSFELPVFEEVPDDFFTRKKFFRQMKRRSTIMKRAMNARELMIDDEGVTRFQHGARLRAQAQRMHIR